MNTSDKPSADESCPVCKSDRYLNPTLTLLVSPCFHKMCEACVNRIFLSGSAPCPLCKTILKKSNFTLQTFSDLYVEKEVNIRKRVGRIFNKRREDFGDLRAYNDYLEEIEGIIVQLAKETDVAQANEKIEQFRLENKDLIAKNEAKKRSEDKAVAFRIEKEKKEKQMRREAFMMQAAEAARLKQNESHDIINKMASTTSKSALKTILQEAKSKQTIAPAFNPLQSISIDYEALNAAEMQISQEVLVSDVVVPLDGLYYTEGTFEVQTNYGDPWTQRLRTGDAARAGGCSAKFTYERALTSAFSNLFYKAEETVNE